MSTGTFKAARAATLGGSSGTQKQRQKHLVLAAAALEFRRYR